MTPVNPFLCLRAMPKPSITCLRQEGIRSSAITRTLSISTTSHSKIASALPILSLSRSLTINTKPRVQRAPSTRKPFIHIQRSHYSSAVQAPAGEQTLTWNRFLTLRRIRRRISLVASVITCAATTAGGMVYLSESDFDRVASQAVGLDPMIVLGLATFGFAGVGWLVGPFAGSAIFNVAYKSVRPEMMKKEKDFFNRIKKHRVDPANSSIQNPVPDFYGEKIVSVAGYRTWLRDQRAFRLKRGPASLDGSGGVPS